MAMGYALPYDLPSRYESGSQYRAKISQQGKPMARATGLQIPYQMPDAGISPFPQASWQNHFMESHGVVMVEAAEEGALSRYATPFLHGQTGNLSERGVDRQPFLMVASNTDMVPETIDIPLPRFMSNNASPGLTLDGNLWQGQTSMHLEGETSQYSPKVSFADGYPELLPSEANLSSNELDPETPSSRMPRKWKKRGGPRRDCSRLWTRFIFQVTEVQAKSYGLPAKVIGARGANMKGIAIDSGAKLRVRGKGSGHLEVRGKSGWEEARVPLQLCVSCSTQKQLDTSRSQVQHLLDTLAKDFACHCEENRFQQPVTFYVELPGLMQV